MILDQLTTQHDRSEVTSYALPNTRYFSGMEQELSVITSYIWLRPSGPSALWQKRPHLAHRNLHD
jgi:hypothetical protein